MGRSYLGFQLAHRFVIAESLSGQSVIFPVNRKSIGRRAETSAQDVIERIEVVSPRFARDEGAADFFEKLFHCGESRAVDFVSHQDGRTEPRPGVCRTLANKSLSRLTKFSTSPSAT